MRRTGEGCHHPGKMLKTESGELKFSPAIMYTYLYSIPVLLYLAGWLGEFLYFWASKAERHAWPKVCLGIGWGAHGLLLGMLLVQKQTSLSVLLTAIAWGTLLMYYLVMWRLKSAVISLVFPPLSIALLITAFLSSERTLLDPGPGAFSGLLSRGILTAHIFAILAGILLFGLACLASIVYLYQEHRLKAKRISPAGSHLPSLGTLEKYNHKAITLGFFFMTVGLLLGLLVSGMDNHPPRLLTLRRVIPAATWLLYAAFLISHDLEGRRGRYGAFWSIAGFTMSVIALVNEILRIGSSP